MGVEAIKDARHRMDKAIEVLQHEFATLRTGRANPGLLENIKIDYYGAVTPINQMASISVPEPKTLLIQPWDLMQIGAMEKAIMTSGLGLTPQNDGKVIRLILPFLTEERRKELVKIARKFAEDAKVATRNIRRDANEALKKLEKEKKLTEDQLRKSEDEVQKLTDNEIKRVDEFLAKKEKEIMEV